MCSEFSQGTAEEGCLSLAGVRKTKRYRKITVKYQDITFRHRTDTFESFTAQIIQHEIDHCNGILI
ncbi:MAG: peptide deformylase [Clostridia bacterium]|nr:peptide deformylase [Clostridia bacterium]